MKLPPALRGLRTMLRSAIERYDQHRAIAAWAEKGVSISLDARIVLDAESELSIGKGSSIGHHTIINVCGDRRDPANRRGKLTIGERTSILEFNNIRAGGGEVRIGNDCLLSQYITIVATNHVVDSPTAPRHAAWDYTHTGVTIEDEVWIGAGAAIMPGITIGRGAVVSAGAVVTHDVPPRAIVGGVPAKLLRYREA